MDEHAVSSSVLERVATAAARLPSFADATAAVRLCDIAVSESQVRRLAHQVGHALIARRDRRAEEHRHRRSSSRTGVTSAAVVVEVDGGRIRTRAASSARGVHDARTTEDKIACLATLMRFPKFGGHEVSGVDSDQGVRRCLGSVRRTRPSSSSRPSR